MNAPKQPRWGSGDEWKYQQANQHSEGIERADNLKVDASSGLEMNMTPTGKTLRLKSTPEIFVKITASYGSGNYGGTQQFEASAGTWTDGSRTFGSTYPLRELNGSTSVPTGTSQRHRAWFAGHSWWFAYCV